MGHKGKHSSQKLHLLLRGMRNISTREEARAFPWWVLSPWHPAHTPSGPQTNQEALTKLRTPPEKKKIVHTQGEHMLSFSPRPISLSSPSPLDPVLQAPAEAEDRFTGWSQAPPALPLLTAATPTFRSMIPLFFTGRYVTWKPSASSERQESKTHLCSVWVVIKCFFRDL